MNSRSLSPDLAANLARKIILSWVEDIEYLTISEMVFDELAVAGDDDRLFMTVQETEELVSSVCEKIRDARIIVKFGGR